ncbi:MAG: ribosome-associated translation inhibitor RaiA [Patescibacteria group bacterium]|nr:ribosome-associated translation inhibitor RaiA [Patescibacteria group bacterium]
MNIIIKGKNIEVTTHIKDYTEKKLKKACSFADNNNKFILEVDMEQVPEKEKGKRFKTKVNLSIPGRIITVESISETIKASIDKIKDEIERQIKDHKEKAKTQSIKGSQKAKKLRG